MPGQTLEQKLFNISLSAHRVSQFEIQPGQVFSFWKCVGNPNRGFKKSRSIIGGALVNENGGGLCQVSGIIYQISLMAGLEILERHNHSMDIYTDETRFAPLGTDATVVYGNKDLRIRNNLSSAIRFILITEAEKLTVRLCCADGLVLNNLDISLTDTASGITAKVSDSNGKSLNTSVYQKPAF